MEIISPKKEKGIYQFAELRRDQKQPHVPTRNRDAFYGSPTFYDSQSVSC